MPGPSPQVEVRLLLGPVRARRADGRLVDAASLRTRKTADLLTILALSAGQGVPVPRLLDALWPDVDPDKGRASLRTAACEVRRALGGDHVRRDKTGVVLTGVWTDAGAFLALAAEAARTRTASPARTLAAAREAEDLHLVGLAPHDSDAAWAVEARDRLRLARTALLGDAAEAAVELSRLRDAVPLATRLLELDPYDERAARCLMLAHTGLGEVERAVQAYVRCREVLAEDLGLDPSPQTRAAYRHVLAAGAEPDAGGPGDLVTDDEVLDADELAAHVAQVLSADPAPELVRQVAVHSGNRAGEAARLLRQWLTACRLVATPRGLALVPEASADALDGPRRQLVALHSRLGVRELEAVEATAALGGPFSVETLARVLDQPGEAARTLVARLTELDLLTRDDDRYALRDPLLGSTLLGWLRPAVRDALGERVARRVGADGGPLPPAVDDTDRAGLRALVEALGTLAVSRDLRQVDEVVHGALRPDRDAGQSFRSTASAAACEPLVLLGAASSTAARLDADLSDEPGLLLASGITPAMLGLLLRHDLGEPTDLAGLRGGERAPRWLRVRLALESGAVEVARAAAASPTTCSGGALARVLDGLALGGLHTADGDGDAARRVLAATLDEALAADVRLLVPEVAARLAAAEAPHDIAGAAEHLETADGFLGETVFGRERVAMLLARAALRAAAARPDAAERAAATAVEVARRTGLVRLEAEARVEQDHYRAARAAFLRPVPSAFPAA